MKMKLYSRMTAVTAVALCFATQVQASGSGMMVNEDMLQELKRMIEQQQAQIDKQAAEIAELKEQLGGADEMIAGKMDKSELEGVDFDKMVTSSLSRVDLGLYGHINKGVMYVDNGDTGYTYVVDNTNSQTRLGLKANVEAVHGWNIGGRIEYGIVANGSSDVNQLNSSNATDDNFKLRWAEVSFANDMYGKLSVGKGSSASDGTTEVDYSGTGMAGYVSISDLAGASLWNDSDTGLTTVQIKDVFNSFDGFSRTDRVRYDTPSFMGVSAAVSGASSDDYDGSLSYSRKFGETRFGGALYAGQRGSSVSIGSQYGGSASVFLPMGLNFSVSAATADLTAEDRDNPMNWWGKLGYQTVFYDGSTTSFSIDYGETSDLAQDGDTAKAFTLSAVHNLSEYGTEIYALFRNHQLDRDAADFDDINVFFVGSRVKF